MKVLLAHASFGWGHRRAAEAIAEILIARGVQTEVRDLLEFIPSPIAYTYSRSYSLMMTHARWLWKAIYHCTDSVRAPYRPYRSVFQRWEFSTFLQYIREQQFTHVISTHFTPAAVLAGAPAKGFHKFSVVTDYTAHRYWKAAGLDAYFVPTKEVKQEFIQSGIPSQKIEVSGIPIATGFAKTLCRNELRLRLNCNTSGLLILVVTSGLKLSSIRSLIGELKHLDATFCISAGKPAPNQERIRRICRDDNRFHIFGFHPRMWELMHAADLLFSKPGGLTASEALAVGIPQILFPPLPGQEEGNARFLVSRGAALPIPQQRSGFRNLLSRLFHDRTMLRQMSEQARLLGKPNAAQRIADAVLST